VKKKYQFAVGGLVIVLALGWLAWSGVNESKTYYHTLAELSSLRPTEMHQRIRVGGNVQAGSIHRLTGRVDFVLEGEGKSLPVSYVGSDPLPDTFIDGSQALIEGKAMPDGHFVAEKVQAKCASKYEAAPATDKKS
jgi:cytochrome c-type biogenesis protein CcmE